MSLNDMVLNNLILSTIIKSEKTKLEYFLIFFGLIIFSIYNNFEKIEYYLKKKNDYKSSILFNATDKKSSKKFRGLMNYISQNCNLTQIKEIEAYINSWDDKIESIYRVNQTEIFDITDEIYGQVEFKSEEKTKDIIEDITILKIMSNKLSTKDLIKFVNNCSENYIKDLKFETSKNQLFIDITWDNKAKEINIKSHIWSSNTTFENKFFNNKDKILLKINNFLENKEEYIKRGLPHTLGILLHGSPGTGKTSFIKALANKTKYHLININLSKNFNFNELEKILFSEKISSELFIPINKRIIIFEDIDCMTEIVKSRDDDYLPDIKISDDLNFQKIFSKLNENENENNNLSYLLNLLDGVQECENRIIIMTTNKPEALDEALIRPGRIDIKLMFTKATTNDIINILNHYWNKTIKEIDEKYNLIYTHAQIINICKDSNNIEDSIINLDKYLNNI